MRATLDHEGKIEIPSELREELSLTLGTEVDVTVDDRSLRVSPMVPGPKLVRVGNRLVARPQVPVEQRPRIDVAEWVRRERDRWPL